MLRDEIKESFCNEDFSFLLGGPLSRALIDFCVKEVEKRIETIKDNITQDRATFNTCGRNTKGHSRALMIIDEILKESKK